MAYFATLAASFHLAAFWLFHNQNREHEFDTNFRLVSETVRFIESFLPRSLHWWTDWYAGNPEWFAGGIIAVAALMAVGSSLSSRIKDDMRVIWQSRGASTVPTNVLHNFIYKFRTWIVYTTLIKVGKLYVVPFLLTAIMVWYGATALSHLSFNIADSMGAFCKESPADELTRVNLGIPQNAKDFQTSSICSPTGLTVQAGHSYELTITVTSPWMDDAQLTTPAGFRTSTAASGERWRYYSGILLRRILFRPWFRLIARVGSTGVDESFLDPVLQRNSNALVYKATFPAQRSGEIFLYVNDAVIGLPWIYDHYFRNNKGSAKITVRLL
ncbi:MAG: hypothetical protein NVV83_22035 [Afipia sp.]|nr:hypothetical protein [Afipia sp.]